MLRACMVWSIQCVERIVAVFFEVINQMKTKSFFWNFILYIRLNDIVPLFSVELLLWKSKDAGLYKKVLTPIFGMAPFSLRIHQWWTSLVCSVVLSSLLLLDAICLNVLDFLKPFCYPFLFIYKNCNALLKNRNRALQIFITSTCSRQCSD